jgi:3alpha(or 20beta)-hydroxysteroid dehydrogenase
MKRLSNKIALITGGARGMGASHAARFIEEGASVIITDVMEEAGRSMAEELGPACHFMKLDVTSKAEWTALVEELETQFGALHVLVANAGVAQQKFIGEATEEHYNWVVDINFKGVFYGAQAVVPLMRRSGGGSIVNISSIASMVGSPGSSVYSASKAAVAGFARALAAEVGVDGIRVNVVHPGFIETDMLKEVAMAEQLLPLVPLGRFGKSNEISSAVLFLASDEGSYVTGASLVADGGFTVN